MAQTDFDLITTNTNWQPQGERKDHIELPEEQRLVNSGERFRLFEDQNITFAHIKDYKTAGVTGSILANSGSEADFPPNVLDGTKAVSIRAAFKLIERPSYPANTTAMESTTNLRGAGYNSNSQVGILFAKADKSTYKTSGVVETRGYNIVLLPWWSRSPYSSKYNRVFFSIYSQIDNATPGGDATIQSLQTINLGNTYFEAQDTEDPVENRWWHLRIDIEPIVNNGVVTADKLVFFIKNNVDDPWPEEGTVVIASGTRFIPWNDEERNSFGFAVQNMQIEDFEIYLSTGFE